MSTSTKITDTTYTKIFVGGLAWVTNSDSLKSYFSQFGEISDCAVIIDKHTGNSKGYGFVTFAEAEAATRACMIPNPVIDGRRCNINLAALGRKKDTDVNRKQRENKNQVRGTDMVLNSRQYMEPILGMTADQQSVAVGLKGNGLPGQFGDVLPMNAYQSHIQGQQLPPMQALGAGTYMGNRLPMGQQNGQFLYGQVDSQRHQQGVAPLASQPQLQPQLPTQLQSQAKADGTLEQLQRMWSEPIPSSQGIGIQQGFLKDFGQGTSAGSNPMSYDPNMVDQRHIGSSQQSAFGQNYLQQTQNTFARAPTGGFQSMGKDPNSFPTDNNVPASYNAAYSHPNSAAGTSPFYGVVDEQSALRPIGASIQPGVVNGKEVQVPLGARHGQPGMMDPQIAGSSKGIVANGPPQYLQPLPGSVFQEPLKSFHY